MALMNRLLCLILYGICSLCVYAQDKAYGGFVCQAESRRPLEFVSVCLLAQDSTIIDYTYTDEKGFFELSGPSRSEAFLSFSCMGYKRMIIPLSEFANASRVILEETTFNIPEVRVSSNRIRQRKDTLIYSVSGFKMPQDRSIEDVLKKIPGIEVAQNGQIKFQDRPISHFYIDGMNLLDSKYTLASKNIPANMVNEIQVLQSHQSIAALRGKSFSDNAALNLILEENAKNRLIGMVDTGAGITQKGKAVWDNRLMAMLFGKKMQNLTMYKNNNTGKDIADEITALTLKPAEEIWQSGSEDNFFSGKPASPKGIERSRYLSNDVHLVATNHLYKLRKEKDLRLQLVAMHDRQSASHEVETIYFYPSQTVVVSEQEKYQGTENRLEAEMSYTQNDTNLYIKNTTKGMIGLHKNELSLFANNNPTHVHNHPQRKLLQNHFHLVKNIGKHSFSCYSNNSYTELPQYMTVGPGLYEDLLNDGRQYGKLRQDALLRAFTSDSYTYFQHKLGGIHLKYKAGLIYENRHLQSQLYADMQPVKDMDYANKVRLETVEAYVEPSVNLKTSYWEFQFRLPLTYHYSHLKNTLPQTGHQSKHTLLPTPALNVKYNLNAYWNISAASAFNFLKPDIRRLYAGFLFDTYRTAQSFTQDLIYDRNIYNRLRLRYNNPLNGLFINVSGFFNQTWQENIHMYDSRKGIISISKSYHCPNTKKNYGGSMRISKATGWSKLYIALSASYNKMDDRMILENNLVDSHLSLASIAADVSLQPSRYINMEANSRATHIKSQSGLNEQSITRIWSYGHSFELNFIFSSIWRAKMTNALTHDSQNRRVTYFADASFTHSRKTWSVEIELHNLFNHNEINNIYVGNWTQRASVYSLRPREILLKIAFSF